MRAVVLSSLVTVAAFVGCSATPTLQFTGVTGTGGATSTTPTGPTGPTGSTGASGMGGDLGFDAGPGATTGTGAGGASGCSAASELVYVFATDNTIWSFNPPTKQFTQIATVDCNTSLSPNSMAVDRNLVAWLNYEDGLGDGAIFKFDLNVKSGCTQAPINLPSGFGQVGMGFATDMVGGTTETLYLDGIGGAGLARVDMSNNTVVPIGTFSMDPNLSGQSAELTGTGDARLFGYFTTFPSVRVAQLDKTTGQAINDVPLTGVSPPSDWAFSFWGGDFYLYAAPGNNSTGNSSVIHYAPASNTVDQSYVADVGFIIIGAGVSTCAPLEQPQ
jgi:hypothetical protein